MVNIPSKANGDVLYAPDVMRMIQYAGSTAYIGSFASYGNVGSSVLNYFVPAGTVQSGLYIQMFGSSAAAQKNSTAQSFAHKIEVGYSGASTTAQIGITAAVCNAAGTEEDYSKPWFDFCMVSGLNFAGSIVHIRSVLEKTAGSNAAGGAGMDNAIWQFGTFIWGI